MKKLRSFRELGATLTTEFILFVFKEINLETYLSYRSLLCRYGGFAHLEIENEGRDYTITLLHMMGNKWPNYLMNVIYEIIKNDLSIVSLFEVTKNVVVVRFQKK